MGLDHMKKLAVFAASVVDGLNSRPPPTLQSHSPLRCDFRCMNALSDFESATGAARFDCIHVGAAVKVRLSGTESCCCCCCEKFLHARASVL